MLACSNIFFVGKSKSIKYCIIGSKKKKKTADVDPATLPTSKTELIVATVNCWNLLTIFTKYIFSRTLVFSKLQIW